MNLLTVVEGIDLLNQNIEERIRFRLPISWASNMTSIHVKRRNEAQLSVIKLTQVKTLAANLADSGLQGSLITKYAICEDVAPAETNLNRLQAELSDDMAATIQTYWSDFVDGDGVPMEVNENGLWVITAQGRPLFIGLARRRCQNEMSSK